MSIMLKKAGLPGGIAILMIIALSGLYATVLTPSEAPSSGPTPQPTPTMTMDERLAQLGEVLPGFGGYYLEPMPRTVPVKYAAVVYMLDACQQEEAERAVKQVLGAEQFGQDILFGGVLQGDYSMVQLNQWYEDVSRITDPGLVLTAVDQGRNRLEIRVADDDAFQRIEAKLKELPVPREAVAIRIKEPVQLYDSARDSVSPTEGDDQISDAELRDLETIAQQRGISLKTAIARYGSQGSIVSLLNTIREAFPADYTGSALGRDGGPSWVGFAGRPPAAALWMIDAFVKNSWGVSVEVRAHLGFSEEEKRRAIKAFHYAVYEAPEVRDVVTGLDPATGRIQMTVVLEDFACDAAVLNSLRATATKALIDATGADILNYVKIDVAYSNLPALGILE